MTPDVNVLVAAYRADHPHHRIARLWIERAVANAESGIPLVMLPMVLSGFVRLVTNPRVFEHPDSAKNALAFTRSLLEAPGVELATLGKEWSIFESLCLEHQLTGNAIPDAWIAASTLHLGEHLVSFDKGFRKWLGPGRLTVLEPEKTE